MGSRTSALPVRPAPSCSACHRSSDCSPSPCRRAPAAIAERVTSRPSHGILVSAALAVLFTWAGLTVAYYVPYPVGFFITTFAFLSYVVARLLSYLGARRTVRPRGWREAQVRHSP